MAARKSNDTFSPEDGDLDGQNNGAGNEHVKSGEDGDARTIDGKPVASFNALGNDDGYVRDENGDIKRNKDGSPRKKRGRKPSSGSNGNSGQTRKGNSKTVNDAVETLSQTLMIVHLGLANFMKFEEMALSKEESDSLSKAAVNVLEQFDVQPDPRITAVTGLVTAASMIYGPRIILYKSQQKKAKKSDTDFNSGLSVVHNGLG